MIRTRISPIAADFRQAIYDGEIFIIPANAQTRGIASTLRRLVHSHYTDAPNLETAHAYYDPATLWQNLSAARQDVATQGLARQMIAPLITPLFNAGSAFDVLRLRCSAHNGHLNSAAAHSYAAHRDTWFANPQAQINFWLPLTDVTPQQGFRFYRRYFDRAINNNSDAFDYDDFAQNVGFQSKTQSPANAYPTNQDAISNDLGHSFSCNAGDLLIFSAAHLHQPEANATGRTRFSVDFRVVDRDDHSVGRGAPNLDNRSVGSAMQDYMHL
tara:strand:- start:94318 stop:95130 length:813 start_codon:yes stop_codon:yes gene_type:complete